MIFCGDLRRDITCHYNLTKGQVDHNKAPKPQTCYVLHLNASSIKQVPAADALAFTTSEASVVSYDYSN